MALKPIAATRLRLSSAVKAKNIIMRYGLLILSLLTSIIFVLPLYAAEDSCSYCGVWIPFSEMSDASYNSSDRLTITEHTIALPGCSPAKSTQVFFTNKTDYGPPEDALVKPLKALLKIEGQINCNLPLTGLSNGALVEINLRPRGYKNSEEIELIVFAPSPLTEIKYADIHVVVPTNRKELGGWWFVREEYDYCSEGEGRGVWICSAIDHKKADEELNTEWNNLLTVIKPDKKKIIISTQKKWLKACSKTCAKEGAESGGYHPWGLAYETFCLARNKIDRAMEFRSLHECISGGKKNCHQLKKALQGQYSGAKLSSVVRGNKKMLD